MIMSLLQVDYALLSSVVAALVLLIPFFGPVVAVALPVTISLLTHPDVTIYLFIALFALQQVIFNVLAPRIMSQPGWLAPLLVFFAVLTGARVAGVWGAIFGVPDRRRVDHNDLVLSRQSGGTRGASAGAPPGTGAGRL